MRMSPSACIGAVLLSIAAACGGETPPSIPPSHAEVAPHGRDWNDAPNAAAEKRGTSDRFALKFIRP